MDGLLLNRIDLQGVQLLVKHLRATNIQIRAGKESHAKKKDCTAKQTYHSYKPCMELILCFESFFLAPSLSTGHQESHPSTITASLQAIAL